MGRLRGVVFASVVTGRYDMMFLVLFKEGFDLLEFYTEEIAGIEGVQSVEAFVVYKGYNLRGAIRALNLLPFASAAVDARPPATSNEWPSTDGRFWFRARL